MDEGVGSSPFPSQIDWDRRKVYQNCVQFGKKTYIPPYIYKVTIIVRKSKYFVKYQGVENVNIIFWLSKIYIR